MKTQIKQNTKAIILGLVIAIGAGYVSAWTGPSLPPTQGNVAAPINVGGGTAGNIYTQTKSGILNLAHLITSDFTVTNADATVTNIPNGSVLVADGDNTGKVKWGNVSGTGGSIPNNIVVVTTSENWTVPTGVTKVRVRAWGAGGGGGQASDHAGSGGGGGAGGYAESVVTVAPKAVISITIGSGGSGQATFTSNNIMGAHAGDAGSNTSFGSYVIADGGLGGWQDGDAMNATGLIGRAGIGGSANTGTISIEGGDGQAGDVSDDKGGSGGSAPGGGQGGLSDSYSTHGQAPGGGGGGAGNHRNGGGNGAAGMVIIEY